MLGFSWSIFKNLGNYVYVTSQEKKHTLHKQRLLQPFFWPNVSNYTSEEQWHNHVDICKWSSNEWTKSTHKHVTSCLIQSLLSACTNFFLERKLQKLSGIQFKKVFTISSQKWKVGYWMVLVGSCPIWKYQFEVNSEKAAKLMDLGSQTPNPVIFLSTFRLSAHPFNPTNLRLQKSYRRITRSSIATLGNRMFFLSINCWKNWCF